MWWTTTCEFVGGAIELQRSEIGGVRVTRGVPNRLSDPRGRRSRKRINPRQNRLTHFSRLY
jgi:hypothetical protein